jgi:TM2 domain-containing membrane protein YozV
MVSLTWTLNRSTGTIARSSQSLTKAGKLVEKAQSDEMATLADSINLPKNRKVAIVLALLGTVLSLPFPIAGLHKFYLGQPLWGTIYLLLGQTPIPRIACAIDAVFYLMQGVQQFNRTLPLSTSNASDSVELMAEAIRELDRLRLDGLISEYEFEQKRRQLLEKIT